MVVIKVVIINLGRKRHALFRPRKKALAKLLHYSSEGTDTLS